jgi:hypothetical protein
VTAVGADFQPSNDFERVKRVILWHRCQGHSEEEVGWEYRRAAESSNRTFSGTNEAKQDGARRYLSSENS